MLWTEKPEPVAMVADLCGVGKKILGHAVRHGVVIVGIMFGVHGGIIQSSHKITMLLGQEGISPATI